MICEEARRFSSVLIPHTLVTNEAPLPPSVYNPRTLETKEARLDARRVSSVLIPHTLATNVAQPTPPNLIDEVLHHVQFKRRNDHTSYKSGVICEEARRVSSVLIPHTLVTNEAPLPPSAYNPCTLETKETRSTLDVFLVFSFRTH